MTKTGSIRGSVILSRLAIVRGEKGDAAVKRVLRALTDEDRKLFAGTVLPHVWYPFEAGERLPSTITDGRVVLCQFVRLGRPRPPVGGTARQYQPHEFGYGQRTTELSYGYSTLRHRPALSFKLSTKVWANFPESSQRSTRSFFARPGTTETLTA